MMNTDAGAALSTPATGAPGDAAADPLAGSAAGRLLGRLTVLPALLAMAWLVAGLPLLLAGRFTPALTVAVFVPLAAVAVFLGLRGTPGQWRGARPDAPPEAGRTPWWAVAAVIAVAVAFAALQLAYHSQQIIVIRDPASYFQFGLWIAHHGSLPIPQDRAAFGGAHPGLSYGTPAFYQVGATIVPQFMAGLPMVVAAGYWAGGASAATLVTPLLGALAVLAFAGLAARLAGPRWAPLAALLLAVTLPEQFTSRSAYSEPLAQILFLGGLCLVIDSLESGRAGTRAVAALGGLALGLTILVRIDGVSDILPVVPFVGMLLIGRRPQALPLLGGLAVGSAGGAVEGLLLSRPYLSSIRTSLIPLAAVVALVLAATAAGVAVRWRRGLAAAPAWLANAAAALVVVVLAGLAARPYLLRPPGVGQMLARGARGGRLPTSLQGWLYELSLHWVFWYLGIPAVLLAALGAALLIRAALLGRAPAWALPLMVFAWIIVTVLYRPAITPTQPWASRRLVPGVLPGVILLAVWGAAWLTGQARQRGHGQLLPTGVAAVSAAALLVPPVATSFDISARSGGLTTGGLGLKRSYAGEIGAVDRLCAALPPRASVVSVDGRVARQFTPVVRSMCGDPAALIAAPTAASVSQVVQGIIRAGRTPVLLAARRGELLPYGGVPRPVVSLLTRGDGRHLTAAPLGTSRLTISVWLSQPHA